MLHNYTHATASGKQITTMKLAEAPKRMHDPKAYLASLFSQERAKFNYEHEDLPNESMYREVVDFQEALENITDLEVKSHVFKYQKDIKQSTLYFKNLRFDAEEKFHRENMEREAR